jgi:hypothetical protein
MAWHSHLHGGGINADVASVVHLDSLREQLAQGFQFVGWIYKMVMSFWMLINSIKN